MYLNVILKKKKSKRKKKFDACVFDSRLEVLWRFDAWLVFIDEFSVQCVIVFFMME